MKLRRRQLLQVAGAVAVSPVASHITVAQTYPTRPITMIVPFVAGGPIDTLGRVLAERMRGALGQPVIIENVGGADGSIGVGRVVRAKADGYTIGLSTMSTQVLNGAFYSLPYDMLNDFTPISPLITFPYVFLTRKAMPGKDVSELIAWLKANPDKVSAGVVTSGYRLLTVFFQKVTQTRFTLVPYRGSAPAVQDLIAGQIDLLFETPVQLPLVRAGSIKAMAVTSEARLVQASDIPTFSEMGLPALSYSVWAGLFGPKGTPKGTITKLNAAAVESLADPAVRSRLDDLGFEVFPRDQQTTEVLNTLVKAGVQKWWPIVKEFGLKAE